MALTAKVEQASRCRDQDVNARLQCLDLVVLVDTPENDGSAERQPSAIGPETLADLAGKFARRRKNQGMRWAGYSRQIFMQQTLQDGKRECGGLARTRLRNSEQILAFIEQGNSLRLDRRGLEVVFGLQRELQGLGKAEAVERRWYHLKFPYAPTRVVRTRNGAS